jgi:hypothetical protein|tara:strand:- start:248 stop:472 length:225 start_codon:yes stop_codon:yes gene_type:complete
MNSNDSYLYLIDYWAGEGFIALIASDNQEVLQLIEDEESFDITNPESMMNSIVNAQRFKLSDEYESDIIDAIIL